MTPYLIDFFLLSPDGFVRRSLSPISKFLPRDRTIPPVVIPAFCSLLPPQDQPLDYRSDSRKTPKKSRESSPDIKREFYTSSPEVCNRKDIRDSITEFDYQNNIPFDLSVRRSRSDSRSNNSSPNSLPPKLANMSLHGKTMNDGGQGQTGHSPNSQHNLDGHSSYTHLLGSRGIGGGNGGGSGGGDDLNGNGGSDGNGGGSYLLSQTSLDDEPILPLVQPSVYPAPENCRFLPPKVSDKSSDFPAPDFSIPSNCLNNNTDMLLSQNSYYQLQQHNNNNQHQLQSSPPQTQLLMPQNQQYHNPSSPPLISPMLLNLRSPQDGHTLESLAGMTQVSTSTVEFTNNI